MSNGRPVCVCKSNCDPGQRKRGRLCGLDRIVYKSVCALQKSNCLLRKNVQVEYFGKCRSKYNSVLKFQRRNNNQYIPRSNLK